MVPHCKKTQPSRAYVLAERTRRFLDAQQPVAKKWLTVEYDVLFLICEGFDTKTLKSLTHFAGIWRYEAHRRLLHTIDYNSHICTPTPNPDEAPWMKIHRGSPSPPASYRPDRLHFNEMAFKCCNTERRRVMYRGLRPTFVQDIRSLCDFLKHNKQLHGFVRHALLRRDADSYEEMDSLVQDLGRAGSLESLHITGLLRPNFNYIRPTSSTLSSVHVDFSIPSVAKLFTPTHLRLLFQSPGLESVHLSHFQHNSSPALYSANHAPGTSSVSRLILTDTLPLGVALGTILSWPRALISLHIESTPETDDDSSELSIRNLFASISLHESTLTHLHLGSLRGNWDASLYDSEMNPGPADTGTLSNFTALKSLDVPFCALARFPSYWHTDDELDVFFLGIRDTNRFLPTSLEKLTIRLGEPFSWREKVWADEGSLSSTKLVSARHAKRFLEWLGGLCRQKEKLFSKLKEVKVLCISSRGQERTESGYEHVYMEEEVASKARDYWAGHGVKLDLRVRDRMERLERVDVGEMPEEGEKWPKADWQ